MLPIHSIADSFAAAALRSNRLILSAPTGSGKSTQIPQILLDKVDPKGQIVLLQPRRIAARMLAARIAEERGCKLGTEVGYHIRFDNVTSAATKIKLVTEGILLRQMHADPTLKGISTVIFDEFHERHLYGDVSLARAIDLQSQARPDLRIVVMSATLDSDALRRYLDPCEVLISEGRTFPVDIRYLPKPAKDYPVWDLAAEQLREAFRKTEGDCLIFMPGSYEIHKTIQAVENLSLSCVALPLHGELQANDQDAAVRKYPKRKVVVATNVAETSLTIDGITLVIDSGLARIPRYDPYRGINTLLVEKVSRASADQRTGRAGRTAPGICIRLWTEPEHEDRHPRELPEIKRLDLAEVVLTLKAAGINNIAEFRWLEAPEPRSLANSEQLLTDLGALEEKSGEITELGRRMLAFPVHPRYARMLLAAHELGCVQPICLIAALTQTRNLLQRGGSKDVDARRDDLLGDEHRSDFFLLTRAWTYAQRQNYALEPCRKLGIHAATARQVTQLFQQFLNIAEKEDLDVTDRQPPAGSVERCILLGFTDQLAVRLDQGTLRCAIVHGRRGLLARESVVRKAKFLVASEVREVQTGQGEISTLLSLATEVEEEWLRELLPQGFHTMETLAYDPAAKRVIAKIERRFRDLVLEARTTDPKNKTEAASLLADEVEAGRIEIEEWNEAVDQWIVRLNNLATWMPELSLPRIGAEDRRLLLEQVCDGAFSAREVKAKPVWPAIHSWLTYEQRQWLDKYAPERIALPNGKKLKLQYSEDQPPVLAAKIQDLYGVEETLSVADRRVTLSIHVLAPNFRPIQVTSNLATFWKETFPKIRGELKRKYPKHDWRE